MYVNTSIAGDAAAIPFLQSSPIGNWVIAMLEGWYVCFKLPPMSRVVHQFEDVVLLAARGSQEVPGGVSRSQESPR